MSLVYDKCIVGAYLSGNMFCGRYASGTIKSIFPGLGYMVENDGYQYLIVTNFGSGSKMSSNFLEFGTSDYAHLDLPDETILFWLKRGFRAKARIYGVEVLRRSLIDPMSEAGLRLRVKVYPFICSTLYFSGMESKHDWDYMKQTGGVVPDDDGESAPIPYELSLKNKIVTQENQWHLMRSRLLSESEAAPYKYTFLQCGKKLLIELDGQKKATVNYLGGDVHLYTPAHSTMCSPAQPFVLSSPPLPSIPSLSDLSCLEDPLWGGDNKFVDAVKRLSDDEIDEGIEETYWDMRRIRIAAEKNQTPLGEDFMNSQKWLDAAYDEKQARREEVGFGEVQAESPYTGIV
jgi:hypothetical protein